MALSYEIDRERRLVRIRMAVSVHADEMRKLMDALREDPDLDPSWPVLVDARDITETPRYNEMVQLVEISRRSPIRDDVRRAFVVNSDLLYGAARMAGILAGSLNRKYPVFRDEKSAERYLLGN